MRLTHEPPAPRHRALMPLLIAGVVIVAVASLRLGPVTLSLDRLLAVVMGHGDPVATTILLDLRLPRTLIGLLVGAMLGLAGAVLQGYLRNPLAEPSVLGASNAAALGAVAAIYFGVAGWHPAMLPLLSIATGLVALLLLFTLAGRAESALTLILAGIAVSTLAGAGISLALNLSPNPFAAMEIMTWLMGSIENRSIDHVWIVLPCVIVGGALLLIDRRALDALDSEPLVDGKMASVGLAIHSVRAVVPRDYNMHLDRSVGSCQPAQARGRHGRPHARAP